MKQVAHITLIEDTTAGNVPKTFPQQTVELTHEANTTIRGVDGKISRGAHPSRILWFGGNAGSLKDITDVRIVGKNGQVLIEGALTSHNEAPRDTANGVIFFVLKPD